MQKSKLFFIVLFICSILQIKAQETNLIFKGTKFYLGNIEADKQPINVSFSYYNKSKVPIRITDIKASNDCKISNWNKQTQIKPGTTGSFKISYSTKNLGVFNENLIVKTDESGTKETILSFGGEIVARKKTKSDFYKVKNGGLRFINNSLDFGELKNSKRKSDTLYFMNDSKKTIKIESNPLNPNFVNIQFFPAEINPSAFGKMLITYDATLRNAFGKTKDTISIQSDDEENPLKDIYLTADIFEDFSKIKADRLKLAPEAYLLNTTYDFRYAKAGTEVKNIFNIKNRGKTQLVIRKIDTSCDCIKVIFADKIRFNRDSPIEIILNTTHLKGNIHETVTLITNDPKNDRIVLHLTGFVD
ncbi:MAG: DUF1573 domain-containing protein [Bacteroidales bacterium]